MLGGWELLVASILLCLCPTEFVRILSNLSTLRSHFQQKATEQGSSVRGEEGTKGDDMLLAIRLSSRGNGISQIIVECYGYIEAVRNALLAQG
jgi:hypothetical protein